MSLPLPVLPPRVLASRAVLAHGFDSRQLQELPYPLDREMDSYGKLQGTFRMKSKNVKIEKVAALGCFIPNTWMDFDLVWYQLG